MLANGHLSGRWRSEPAQGLRREARGQEGTSAEGRRWAVHTRAPAHFHWLSARCSRPMGCSSGRRASVVRSSWGTFTHLGPDHVGDDSYPTSPPSPQTQWWATCRGYERSKVTRTGTHAARDSAAGFAPFACSQITQAHRYAAGGGTWLPEQPRLRSMHLKKV